MSDADTRYTPYHPRWYRRRVSVWWWLKNPTYTGFVLRELSAIPVAFFAFVLIWQLRALAAGTEAYSRFLARIGTPAFLVLHALAFVFVLVHSLTWFHLAPKAMAVRLQGKRVPDAMVVGANYLAWLVLSALVAAIVLGV